MRQVVSIRWTKRWRKENEFTRNELHDNVDTDSFIFRNEGIIERKAQFYHERNEPILKDDHNVQTMRMRKMTTMLWLCWKFLVLSVQFKYLLQLVIQFLIAM